MIARCSYFHSALGVLIPANVGELDHRLLRNAYGSSPWRPGTMTRRAKQNIVGPVLFTSPTRNGASRAGVCRELDRIAERRVQIHLRLTRERA